MGVPLSDLERVQRWKPAEMLPIDRAMGAQPFDADKERSVSAELARRIAAGDREAETELVLRYGKGVLYVLRRWCSDQQLAEDIWQDTFRIALEKLRESMISDPSRLAGYLRGIAQNLVTGDTRKKVRQGTSAQTDLVEKAQDHRSDPLTTLTRGQVQVIVRELLEELTVKRDREILRRLFVHDEDRTRICQDLQLDPQHFNRVLHRAKKRFRELLLKAEHKRGLRLVD